MKSKRNAARPQDNRFLIVSTTALGDTLWGTPAIKALRETYPDSYIAALTSPIGKEILLHNPHIDEIFLLKNPALPSLLSLYGTLKKRHFSHAFIFHTSQRPVLPCVAMLSPPMIIGSKDINKGLDFLLTHCFATDGKTHEIQRRLQLVSQVGAYPSTCDMELFLHPEDERIACQWLDSLSLPAYLPRIAFHPGAKDAFKQWPASHFIALGQRLSSHLGCAIFVTGTPAEKALVEQIASGIPGAISATHLPLRAFAALIKKMNVMVANDTGPMHVAFAMKTPTVALFAPTDPALCGPYRINSATIIAKPPTCQPCLRRKCPYSFCLLQIGVQEVYDATLRMFYGAR
ncbi:MAG TPA: glycosyltransferase family 9 protein [Rhabdochlamydiaceae bacterium]